jgi:sugar fermentation stimulation protein A
MKGSYILLIQLPEGQTIKVGSVPDNYFPRGYYAYVGSAMGGLKPRLNRHLIKNKRPHWHIDYLLQKASISGIILCQAEERVECLIAQALSHQFDSIPGFGSSDCKCRSHLFFAADEKRMKSTIMAILNSLPIDKKIHVVGFLPKERGKND